MLSTHIVIDSTRAINTSRTVKCQRATSNVQVLLSATCELQRCLVLHLCIRDVSHTRNNILPSIISAVADDNDNKCVSSAVSCSSLTNYVNINIHQYVFASVSSVSLRKR